MQVSYKTLNTTPTPTPTPTNLLYPKLPNLSFTTYNIHSTPHFPHPPTPIPSHP
ncbi:hypothetical protein K505DRAFT_330389 [Melanomma pulvis-pyrius CBS 109.77]|uniref:Uncharacterized protein n=1 Tax=Melanomma pulvis-pyrius CBS 109.77 TaxID=1314802 RepID=A0A6A6WQN4_9PLEO|nr:hypothetical protein K505DRAFT_330389 [Melanomma pulvis-pyrius CBS 109.77]